MNAWIISYAAIGIIFLLLNSRWRFAVSEHYQKNLHAPLLFILITGALWPICLLLYFYVGHIDPRTLAEFKKHYTQKDGKDPESDEVLSSYYENIVKELKAVAKERGEKIPKATIKELSLFYMKCWVRANDDKLGGAFLMFTLPSHMKTYREEGIQSLLQRIRKMESELGRHGA